MHLKRSVSKFSTIFDPFLILGIFVLFLVPVLTVLNLTPIYKPPVVEEKDILGAADPEMFIVAANTEVQDGIYTEMTSQNSPDSFMMHVNMEPRSKGTYQNKLFNVYNPYDEQKTLNITSGFEDIPLGTKISIMVDGVKFVVLDTDGTTYPPTIYVAGGEALDTFIVVEVSEDLNFSSGFGVGVVVE
ncbi:MAG: hypothetical protein U9Q67_05105 [Patescibacteria group bacterium]|nr:hypothetical protein [Patescibacteria group bacterium]